MVTTIGGAKKGFIFDDAMSNVWKKTVVQSDKQFPTVLRRFCCEQNLPQGATIIICDTYIVNIL